MIVYKSELSNGNIKSVLDLLNKEIEESNKIMSSINEFIGVIDSGQLIGSSYSSVKKRISMYVPILQKRISVASNLLNAINSATNQMSNYMAEDSMLDDSKLPELRAALNNAKNALDELLSAKIFTSEIQNEAYAIMAQIEEISKKIKKLELLVPTDASAYGKITGISGDIGNYQSLINEMISNPVSIDIC